MNQRQHQAVADRVEAFLNASRIAQEEHPEWRLGQAHFNVLYSVDPDLADSIHGTVADPFYIDGRMSWFMSAVTEKWKRDAVL